ncbi:hypothetical protein PSTG_07221 [Puccinia striiformis f. sp. tritici PST-78]|uniref:RING-type domain-containing protein n=2 Tax=Puccinia striiformis f. sp. tritici TaxID=168172 RepID=A0A0L0VJR3_9BASI|nr:hypothetical protein PSTG_07221 [Puccinia striiformis f. sp. tritici PST-78]
MVQPDITEIFLVNNHHNRRGFWPESFDLPTMFERLFFLILIGNSLGAGPQQQLARLADSAHVAAPQSASEAGGLRSIWLYWLYGPRAMGASDQRSAHSLPALESERGYPRHDVAIAIRDEEPRGPGTTSTIGHLHPEIGQASCSHIDARLSDSKKEATAHGEDRQMNAKCPICFTKFDPSSNPPPVMDCGHRYDQDCLDSWLWTTGSSRFLRCSLCREPLRKEAIPLVVPKDRPEGVSEDMVLRRAIWQKQMDDIDTAERRSSQPATQTEGIERAERRWSESGTAHLSLVTWHPRSGINRLISISARHPILIDALALIALIISVFLIFKYN